MDKHIIKKLENCSLNMKVEYALKYQLFSKIKK